MTDYMGDRRLLVDSGDSSHLVSVTELLAQRLERANMFAFDHGGIIKSFDNHVPNTRLNVP